VTSSIAATGRTSSRPAPGLAAMAILALALRLALVWSGWGDRYVVTDDAYYYFAIARNVVAGLGSTFDGIAPTNGYHPLYLLTLLPVWFAARSLHWDAWTPVRVALSLCAAFDVGAGLLLHRLVKRHFSARGATWAAALWLFSPLSALLAMRGVESALAALLLVAFLLASARALERGAPGVPAAAGVGALLGLAALARTDNAPLLALALAVQLALAARAARSGPGAALRALLVAGGAAALVLSPWWLWCWRRFGTIAQVSGVAKMRNHAVFGHLPTASGAASPGRVLRSLFAFAWSSARYATGEEFAPPRWTRVLAPLVAVALGAALAVALRRARRAGRPAAVALLAAGGTYVLAHMLVYAFVLRSYATWYAVNPLLVLALAAGAAIAPRPADAPARRGPSPRGALATAACALAAALLAVRFFTLHPPDPRGPWRDEVRVFGAIRHEAPAVRTVGLYNAGRLGYFVPTLGPWRITNLDCVVNNAAFAAWERGAYDDWVIAHVDLLLLSAPGEEPRAWMSPDRWRRLLRLYPRWPDALQPGGGLEDVYGPRRGLGAVPAISGSTP